MHVAIDYDFNNVEAFIEHNHWVSGIHDSAVANVCWNSAAGATLATFRCQWKAGIVETRNICF